MSDSNLDAALTTIISAKMDSLLDEAISIVEDILQNTDIECGLVINKCGSTSRCNEAQRHLRQVKEQRTERSAIDLYEHIHSSTMHRKCTEAIARQRVQRSKWERLLVVLAAIYGSSKFTDSKDFTR